MFFFIASFLDHLNWIDGIFSSYHRRLLSWKYFFHFKQKHLKFKTEVVGQDQDGEESMENFVGIIHETAQ